MQSMLIVYVVFESVSVSSEVSFSTAFRFSVYMVP